MKYLLDTNAVIDYLRGKPALVHQLRSHDGAGIVTSSVVAAEFYVGYYATLAGQSKSAKGAVKRLFQNYPMLNFEAGDGEETGRMIVRFGLIKQRAIYRDVMIAAQAKNRSLTIVTNNTGDFFRLVGLKVENWVIEPAS